MRHLELSEVVKYLLHQYISISQLVTNSTPKQFTVGVHRIQIRIRPDIE